MPTRHMKININQLLLDSFIYTIHKPNDKHGFLCIHFIIYTSHVWLVYRVSPSKNQMERVWRQSYGLYFNDVCVFVFVVKFWTAFAGSKKKQWSKLGDRIEWRKEKIVKIEIIMCKFCIGFFRLIRHFSQIVIDREFMIQDTQRKNRL